MMFPCYNNAGIMRCLPDKNNDILMSINDDEKDLFRKAVKGVKPLKAFDKIFLHPKKSSVALKKNFDNHETSIYLSDAGEDTLSHEAFVNYISDGVQPRYFKKLKAGKIPIEAQYWIYMGLIRMKPEKR